MYYMPVENKDASIVFRLKPSEKDKLMELADRTHVRPAEALRALINEAHAALPKKRGGK